MIWAVVTGTRLPARSRHHRLQCIFIYCWITIYLWLQGFKCISFAGFTVSVKRSHHSWFFYMCCGYMTGHLQHLTGPGAAFLPGVYGATNRLKDHQLSLNISCLLHLSLYMLAALCSPWYKHWRHLSYPRLPNPVLIFRQNVVDSASRFSSHLKNNLFLIIALGVLSFGMTLANLDILPHITRGEIQVMLHW